MRHIYRYLGNWQGPDFDLYHVGCCWARTMLAMPPGSSLPLAVPCGSARCAVATCRRHEDRAVDAVGVLDVLVTRSVAEGPADPEALTATILARLRAEGLLPVPDGAA